MSNSTTPLDEAEKVKIFYNKIKKLCENQKINFVNTRAKKKKIPPSNSLLLTHFSNSLPLDHNFYLQAIISLVEIAGKTLAAAATADPTQTAKVEGLSQSYLKQVEVSVLKFFF